MTTPSTSRQEEDPPLTPQAKAKRRWTTRSAIGFIFVLVVGQGTMSKFRIAVDMQHMIFSMDDIGFSGVEPSLRVESRQMSAILVGEHAQSNVSHTPLIATTFFADEEPELLIAPTPDTQTITTHHTNYYAPLTDDNLWNTSDSLPDWLKDYFAWHKQQRLLLNESNWQQDQFQFLAGTAFKGRKSGGMTDRIRPIPALIRLAAQTRRILLFHWGRPCALEEFLLPPLGGMDWRVPDYMANRLKSTGVNSNWDRIVKAAGSNDTTRHKIIATQYQSWNYGELWYKEQKKEDEPDLYIIFRDIWKVVFTPSPPVAELIYTNFDRMGLVPGEFATAHIRALYAVEDRPKEEIDNIAKNAMNCVSNLRPGGPFFVASDSFHAIQTAIDYGKEHNVSVVAASHAQEPLHVDFQNESDTSLTPAHFYDGFVDLFLMAGTRCAAVGPGGFARWGHLLGYNETCVIHHFGRKSRKCEWRNASSANMSMPGYLSEEERLVLQAEAKIDMPRFPVPILAPPETNLRIEAEI